MPAADSVPKSLDETREPSDNRYANNLSASGSATHIVTPSDHTPKGLLLPAADRVLTSSAGFRSPGDGVVNVRLAISFTSLAPLVQPELSYAVYVYAVPLARPTSA